MKQLFRKLAVFFCLLFATTLVAQIRKPILMAVPSEAWCAQNGYIVEIINNGNKVRVADYKRAIKENTNLKGAISIMEQLMHERNIMLMNFGIAVIADEQWAANNKADSTYKAENSKSSLDEILIFTRPNILLELMSSGLPIASSKCGPMPEILRDGGIFFDPEDRYDIISALETLIINPRLRSQLSDISFAHSRNFTWNRCADETFAFLACVYRQSINRRTLSVE